MNIELKTLFIIISVFLGTMNVYSQWELPEEDKNHYINLLSNDDSNNRLTGLSSIAEYKIFEARDSLLSKIWNDEITMQIWYLEALHKIEYAQVYQLALDYIDTLATNPRFYSSEYLLEYKVRAISILFDFDDFTMANFVFDLIERDKPRMNYFAFELLKDIAQNLPEFEQRAKTELFYFVENAHIDWYRTRVLRVLEELYGDEIYEQMKKMAREDSFDANRIIAIEDFVVKYKKEDLNSFLRERLLNEPVAAYRLSIAWLLIEHFGKPNDYKFLEDYMAQENDEQNVFILNNDMESFFPPKKPDSTETERDILDTLIIHKNECFEYGWIYNQVDYDSLSFMLNDIRTDIVSENWSVALSKTNSYLQFVKDANSQERIHGYAYIFLRYYYKYLKERLVELVQSDNPHLLINLVNSSGNLLTGGSLKYYEGGWKDAIDNGDGIFKVETERSTVSLRMIYAYGSQDVSNITAQNNTYTFQTVNTEVRLIDSQGNPITEEATVKYYSGGWQDFGTTVNGVANKELLPNNYSFRMNYAFASKDKKQDLNTDPVVVFQTVNVSVLLNDSEGSPITDIATVKYYSGGWRDFGTIANGVINKELLPNNYSFRMNYAFANKDKKQDLSADPVVVFQTVNSSVLLNDSQGNPITEEATVKYYSGGWRDFGTTANGVTNKELLPNNYSFRMNYAFASKDKKQDLNNDPVVVFQTVNASVLLNDSQGNPITEEATVKYYSGGWRDFGTTVNGVANKELLPNNYSFRMNYAFASKDKKQDLNTDPVVVFQTVNASVQLNDSHGNPISEEAIVKYYSGGWRDFGTTINGVANKELLPNNYSFRLTYVFVSSDKKQDLATNSNVVFSTVQCVVRALDSGNQLLDNTVIKYYSGGWRDFGSTFNGEVTKELLPANLSFRGTYNSLSKDVKQDISNNNVVEIIIE